MPMKETWAEELTDKRIKITSVGKEPIFTHLEFRRVDTGELIENVESAEISMRAGEMVKVRLILVHVDFKRIFRELAEPKTAELDILGSTVQFPSVYDVPAR